ncbi:MAG: pyruvate carboxylase subunit B, partial [Myxococcota bacterium]|nr:pyruvate carboxylase subunit B [Myxococcota bacterium]
LAGGSSLPAVETLATMAEGAGRATRLDLDAVEEASAHMRAARARYRDVDSGRTGVDGRILRSQIPGGMLSNLVAQLRDMGASERLGEVLDEVPRVRAEMGYPPLVTPSSQIVGAQATLNVVGGARYAIVANETRDYFRGLYGRPPAPVDPDLAARLLGGERPTDVRPADILPPEVEPARREHADLRPTDEDVLSLVMFPAVARKFIAARRGAAAAAAST